MLNNVDQALRISRQLTPENQAVLLDWIHLAYIAENAARKVAACGAAEYSAVHRKSRGYPCENIMLRSKK